MGNKTSSPKPGKTKGNSQHEVKAQQGQQTKPKVAPKNSSNSGGGSGRRASTQEQQQQLVAKPSRPPSPPQASTVSEDNAPIEAAVEEIPFDEEGDGPEVVNLMAEPVLVPLDDPSIIATVVTAETIYLTNVEKQHVERLVADGMTETDALQHILSKREADVIPRGTVTAAQGNAVTPTNGNSSNSGGNSQLSGHMMFPNQSPMSAGQGAPMGAMSPPMAMGGFPQPPTLNAPPPQPNSMLGIAANQSMYQNQGMIYGANPLVSAPSQSFYPAPSPSLYEMPGSQPSSMAAMAPPPNPSMYDMNMMNGYPPQYPNPAMMPPSSGNLPHSSMPSAYGNYYAAPPPNSGPPPFDPNMQGYFAPPPPPFYGGLPPPASMPPSPMQYPPTHPNGTVPYVPMAPTRRESLSSRVSVSSGDSLSDSGASHLTGRVKVNDIKKLTKMGFRRDDAIQALLRTNNDSKRATEMLLEWQRGGRR